MIGIGKRLMGKPPSGVDLKAIAIAVWEFNEDSSATTLIDVHGSYDGDLRDNGMGSITTGITSQSKLGKCHYFDPFIDPEIRIYSTDLARSSFAYYSWIKPTVQNTRGLVVGAGGNAYTHGWGLMLSSAGHFTCEYGDGSSNYDFDFGSYSSGNYYFVGLEWDGSDFKAYVDNVLKYTETNAPFSYHPSTPQNYAWKFGQGAPTEFEGYYDLSAFFSRPLTDAERAFLWNNGDGIEYINW